LPADLISLIRKQKRNTRPVEPGMKKFITTPKRGRIWISLNSSVITRMGDEFHICQKRLET
jgi:hypothetical protein